MTKNRVITIGDFDGVHLGHQAVLKQLTAWAASLHAEPMIFTFDQNTKGQKVITGDAVKAYYFRQYGVECWQTLSFARFKERPAEEFTDHFLKEEWSVVGLVSGQDFHFGKDRAGNEFTLISRGIAVQKLQSLTAEDLRISSSGIRREIEDGNLEWAEERMGHPFCLMGTVGHGKGLARQYGLPTVNLSIPEQQLLPPFGVYAAFVHTGNTRYSAAVNIGVRPTVDTDGVPNLEAHLLGADVDLYGQPIRVELKSYLRKEIRFQDEEQLFAQMKNDAAGCRARLETIK